MRYIFLLITFLFISCAVFQKDCNKECEDIIKISRSLRLELFEEVKTQDRQIIFLKQENDSLRLELKKCTLE